MDTKTTVETTRDAELATIASVETEDAEAKIAQLEAEKAKIATERDNYRIGMLKAKGKSHDDEETDEEKFRRIAREELAESRLADIAREQDIIIKNTLKENKELRTVLKNKPSTTPVSTGSEPSKAVAVPGIIAKEDIDMLKARGWDDKKIEALKKNIQKNANRR